MSEHLDEPESDVEDEFQSSPPDEETIIYRVAALVVHIWRCQLELQLSGDPTQQESLSGAWNEFNSHVVEAGLVERLSENERELYCQPFGSWDEGDVFESVWRLEAIVGLLWAIQLIDEMPTYTEPADGQWVINKAISGNVAEIKKLASLRSLEEIEDQRWCAEFWNWRSRTRMMRMQGMIPPDGDTFEAVVARALESAVKDGYVDETTDGDISVNGVPYRDLPDENWASLASVAMERHYALNWLCGCANGNDWDQTPLDT